MSDVYHWQTRDGAWQLARRVWSVPPREAMGGGSHILVQKLYDPPGAEPVWVPESSLRPYPETEIESP